MKPSDVCNAVCVTQISRQTVCLLSVGLKRDGRLQMAVDAKCAVGSVCAVWDVRLA